MTDWDAVIMHLRATPGEELLVLAGAGTGRIRPLMGKGLKVRAHKVGKSPARYDIYAMQPVDAADAAYRIMTLVEMCSGSLHEVGGETNPTLLKALGWLDANPGRWFLVGEGVANSTAGSREVIGIDSNTLKRYGYEQAVVNGKVYARREHASGLPITNFVTRRHARSTEPLPTLAADPFNWTVSEMRSALSTAREWLLGAETHAAAA